jgi:1,4-alpha-glucan branching enzyme
VTQVLPLPADPQLVALLEGRATNPHALLGPARAQDGWRLRAFRPDADSVALETAAGAEPMPAIGPGLFEWRGGAAPAPGYRLRGMRRGHTWSWTDPYAFAPSVPADDLYLLNTGRLLEGYRALGAQPLTIDNVSGFRFAVWAPNAQRVSVVGDFNQWDGRLHPMSLRGSSGVWELFVPDVPDGAHYKYEIRTAQAGAVIVKSDPYAQRFEHRPGTASRTTAASRYSWGDSAWIEARRRYDWLHAPFNVYEVHAGSWRRHPDGRTYQWRELAEALVPYVKDMGYTHIELLPVTEHPLDESWGYQTTGYFAPTSRFGEPDGLRAFIDACHRAGIGVLLDWVPAHFPADAHALAHFDGTGLYEHEDPRLGRHQDWGTHIFNYGRSEVLSFLLSSAHYWLSAFHFDGLRVDAVASMIHLDYSRKHGEWLPNKYGGRENLEAIEFLRTLNTMVHGEFPGAVTIAEDSTEWPGVSRPVYTGGLGFSMKWNMGWMNDTLRYIKRDPVFRRFNHNELTFGQMYAYNENFLLPLSHDEVVHGKASLLSKAPGDEWQKFASARLLLAYQMTCPGKKLLFMGCEIGQWREWSEAHELDWWLLAHAPHAGLRLLARDLNRLYAESRDLHSADFERTGFQWIDCHDADHSIVSFLRRPASAPGVPLPPGVAVVLNFTPVVRRNYRIGVPVACRYREVLNTDSTYYGGSNVGNDGQLVAEALTWMGQPASLSISVPPLAALILAPIDPPPPVCAPVPAAGGTVVPQAEAAGPSAGEKPA